LKTSAGRRSGDNDKISRRLELVRNPRLITEKSNRRFRIGIADNLFVKDVGCAETKSPDEIILSKGSVVPEALDRARSYFLRTDMIVGLAAGAGLILGYLMGRRRK
jgi:hypothetical protein